MGINNGEDVLQNLRDQVREDKAEMLEKYLINVLGQGVRAV